MTTLDYLHRVVVPASSQLLPSAMHSPQATAMLLAIALQESAAAHRKQVEGPAKGWWQFEQIGVAGVLEHIASRAPIQHVCTSLRYAPSSKACHTAIEHNDILAGCFARCLLWTLPDPLPERTRPDVGWKQYLKAWRPGKPHPGQWLGNFEQAWALVAPPEVRRDQMAMSSEMQQLVAEGYFDRVRTGDHKAASLFARLVALRMNPTGDPGKPGWLRKGGGQNVEGYAEDAIVLNGNPADLSNVVDLVGGAGAPGASPTWNGPLPRRSSDIWEAPKPLTLEQLNYLKPGGSVDPGKPPPPPPPPVVLPDRGEMMAEGQFLHAFYVSPGGLQRPQGLWIVGPDGIGHPDWEGIAAWLWDVYLKARVAGKSRAEARADYITQIRQSAEWRTKHPGETP